MRLRGDGIRPLGGDVLGVVMRYGGIEWFLSSRFSVRLACPSGGLWWYEYGWVWNEWVERGIGEDTAWNSMLTEATSSSALLPVRAIPASI
jgi:hypothetical protein